MRLHGFPYSHNTRKVAVTAAHLGIDLELRVVDLIAKQSFTPAFKRLNPNGLTPVLEDGDLVLWESGAIMQYLCGLAPGQDLWPTDNRARADVDRWLYWNARHWDPALDPIVLERMVRPLEGHATDEAVVERHLAWARTLVPVLEGHLTGRNWAAGPGFSLADIALASLVIYHPFSDLPVEGRDAIWAWYERVAAQPAWGATEPDWGAIAPAVPA